MGKNYVAPKRSENTRAADLVNRQCVCPDCDKKYSFPVTLKTHQETKNDRGPILMTCQLCLDGIDYGNQD